MERDSTHVRGNEAQQTNNRGRALDGVNVIIFNDVRIAGQWRHAGSCLASMAAALSLSKRKKGRWRRHHVQPIAVSTKLRGLRRILKNNRRATAWQ